MILSLTFHLQLASQHLSILETILQAFHDIAAVMPRIDRLRATFGDEASFQRVLGLLYGDVAEFFQRTYKLFRRRAWSYWFPADWALFQRRFRSILEKLEAHCEILDKEAAAIHYAKMREEIERRKIHDEEFEKQRQLQMTCEVISSLSGESADEQEDCHHRLSNSRLLQTCDWVLDRPNAQSWIEEEPTEPLLWLVGIPGAGKSMVCSFLIEHLSTDNARTLLYLFGGKAHGTRETCSQILCTFAVQYLRQHPDMAPLVHEAFVRKGSRKSISSMKILVKELLKSSNCNRIIIDGLDEYNEELRKEILKTMQDILCDLPKLSGQSHKLLISSRDLPHIDKLIQKRTRISLNERPFDALQIYVRGLVADLKSSLEGFEDAVFEKIQSRFEEKAQGMFLYVKLVKGMLETCGSQADLEDALERLPDGLDEAYGVILERINNTGSKLTRARVFGVLFWLCTAYRPFSIYEIADGIVLKSDCTVLSKATRIRTPAAYLLDKCRPLMQSRDGTLELVHFTAKEYLLDEGSGQYRSKHCEAFIDIADAHHDLTFACIANLNDGLRLVPKYALNISEVENDRRIIEGAFGLHGYAHEYWLQHFQAYLKHLKPGSPLSGDLLRLFQEFLKIRKSSLPNATDPAFEKVLSSVQLKRLSQHAEILDLIFDHLSYKNKLESNQDTLEDANAQQEWQLQRDTTYLTLIDVRIRQATERLLALDTTSLPHHLNAEDFQAFKERFAFECRVSSCNKLFKTSEHRDEHEKSHFVTFPCTQCDFAIRGFKSKRDLDKHVERYHMSTDEFAVPENIFATSSQGGASYRTRKAEIGRQNHFLWTGKGHDALKKTFEHAVSELRSYANVSGNFGSSFVGGNGAQFDAFSSELENELQHIESKIEMGHYWSRKCFIDEVGNALRSAPSMHAHRLKELEDLCESRLDDSITAFPLLTDSRSRRILPEKTVVTRGDESGLSIAQEVQHMHQHSSYDSPPGSILKPLSAYWSAPETAALPNLLRRFRKDFASIADYMKTKSAQEVESHLLALSNENQSEISVILKELDKQDHEFPFDPHPNQVNTEDEVTKLQDLSNSHSSQGPFQHYWMGPVYHGFHAESTSLGFQANPVSENISVGGQTPSEVPSLVQTRESNVTRRVRQHPKMICRYCTQEKQLQGEHALERHIKRFHHPTREVWICKDLSPKKTLLATCDKCLKRKRYSNQIDAIDHLQSKHFPDDTVPAEELRRWWLKRITEPNPNYSGTSAELHRPPRSGLLPSPWKLMNLKPSSKHHRIQRTKELAESAEGTTSNSPYSEGNAPSDATIDWESAFREADSDTDMDYLKPLEHLSPDPFDTFIAPDISFDDILSSTRSASQPQTPEIKPRTFDKNFLRPDQVPKLPHIEHPRRVALQREVSKLHQKLDGLSNTDSEYTVNFEKLRSISEHTMIDLRAWKRKAMQESPTPSYPWSLKRKRPAETSEEDVFRSSLLKQKVDLELDLRNDATDSSSSLEDIQTRQGSSRGDQTEMWLNNINFLADET